VNFQTGDKVKLKAGVRLGQCGTLRQYFESGRIKYLVIREARSSTYIYDAYDENNLILTNCGGCLKDSHLERYYEIGVNIMEKNFKAGDVIDKTAVLVAFPSGSQGHRKAGEKFVVINTQNDRIKKFQIVELSDNDGSGNPEFRYNAHGNSSYIDWSNLSELPKMSNGKAEKPVVASTMTIYSDGVEVNEKELRFEGQTFTREALTALVAKHQEILRRPIAVVPEKAVAPKRTRAARTKKLAVATAATTPKA